MSAQSVTGLANLHQFQPKKNIARHDYASFDTKANTLQGLQRQAYNDAFESADKTNGRQIVHDTLVKWFIPKPNSARYDYASFDTNAATLTGTQRQAYNDAFEAADKTNGRQIVHDNLVKWFVAPPPPQLKMLTPGRQSIVEKWMKANHPTETKVLPFYTKGQPGYCFTNFSDHPIKYKPPFHQKELVFPTSEHFYQWHKFMNNPKVQEEILSPKYKFPSDLFDFVNPKTGTKPTVDANWQQRSASVMAQALELKVQQNPDVMAELKKSGDAILVEDSDKDSFYGIGLNGDGENRLGYAWMALRNKLFGV